jgi:hypothetical protein
VVPHNHQKNIFRGTTYDKILLFRKEKIITRLHLDPPMLQSTPYVCRLWLVVTITMVGVEIDMSRWVDGQRFSMLMSSETC